MNKAGFTVEQQRELIKLMGIATRAARVTTESTIGTNEAIIRELSGLITYIRETYPNGPTHIKESLDNICRFCDLDTIIHAVYDDDPTLYGPNSP